ncbi:16S rRNA (cytosine(967)-C(5))-methyltransferase RsmB [Alcanivorax sp. 1008]|uniref:16S rRNA (cytosine(967)-C(5))-methyltransferase RsmB n=1 Tax=Alcanivorax sp. 1008 TaxID=2816853 RepID=UPI001D8D29B1|nr:16S rRNA (cytosine(967)-C(5))-methyltransferase RsmB [Alcanivorax sp. 1008]MCC1496233.1 16S rRNA (cytosine(967)-C(5))-methyltransferase RsmB [Alcanivorax sp. 1008]
MADNVRVLAVRGLLKILPAEGGGKSLREVLADQPVLLAAERGLLADLMFGVCRHQRLLDHWLNEQMDKPLKSSAKSVRLALLCGIYELWFSERPQHAVVNAWPDVCRALNAPWAAGLCNALMRKASRSSAAEVGRHLDIPVRCSLPDWLWQRLDQAWPEQANDIAEAALLAPPFTMRLSDPSAEAALVEDGFQVRRGSLAPQAAYLSPARPVQQVPGFKEGLLSVQDEAAQLPALLIEAPKGGRILDACAAPGGKTGQLAEYFPDAELIALDIDGSRLQRVRDNLNRLHRSAILLTGDAGKPDSWWDGQPFDAVLLDAPCSATGILRRQPDLKWHRRDSDIDSLCGLQARILDAIWPLVRPGGVLVYATCSILPEENAGQVQAFLARHGDAREDTPVEARSVITAHGCQLLPVADGPDGFFYARMRKTD